MKISKIIASTILFASFFLSSKAQEGYRIEVEVNGLEEGDLMLGYHYGNNKYLLDTSRVVSEGRYLFEGNDKLDPGVYILVFPGNTFFDLIIDQDQQFGINTSTIDFLETTTFLNSPENTSFFTYLTLINKYRQQIAQNNSELQNGYVAENRKQEILEQNRLLNSKIKSSQDGYIQEFPEGLFGKILLAQRDPEQEDAPHGLTEDEKRVFNYNQYKNRYWENFDFSDHRILRTPVFYARLNQFFSEILGQSPDTIISEANLMVNRARGNQEVFRYTVWFITNHFEKSQIMGHDAVFVHMLENYYVTDDAFWVTDESRANLAERVRKMKPLLIGKVAPDIDVFFANRQKMSLHQVESNYTILYFWDSQCGHCKRETPKLNNIFKRFKNEGVKVFSLNLDNDSQLWLKAIEEYQIQDWVNVADPYNESGFRDKFDVMATPIIYLLDQDKRILAKRIEAQVLEVFMEQEIGVSRDF